jgi:predicted nucleotidyltransferase
MNKKELKLLQDIFRQYPALKLVYLFGSRASGKAGISSDYDFAFYIDEEKTKAFYTSLDIAGKISKAIKTEDIDTVVINNSEYPELKYSIIKNGEIIYEIEPYKLLLEPGILNEYFDFRYLLRKYNLTKT